MTPIVRLLCLLPILMFAVSMPFPTMPSNRPKHINTLGSLTSYSADRALNEYTRDPMTDWDTPLAIRGPEAEPEPDPQRDLKRGNV